MRTSSLAARWGLRTDPQMFGGRVALCGCGDEAVNGRDPETFVLWFGIGYLSGGKTEHFFFFFFF